MPQTRWLQAFVRSVTDDDKLTVTLMVAGKQRNLTRCGAALLAMLSGSAAAQLRRLGGEAAIRSRRSTLCRTEPRPLPPWHLRKRDRPKDEPLEKPLARLKANITPAPSKQPPCACTHYSLLWFVCTCRPATLPVLSTV